VHTFTKEALSFALYFEFSFTHYPFPLILFSHLYYTHIRARVIKEIHNHGPRAQKLGDNRFSFLSDSPFKKKENFNLSKSTFLSCQTLLQITQRFYYDKIKRNSRQTLKSYPEAKPPSGKRKTCLKD